LVSLSLCYFAEDFLNNRMDRGDHPLMTPFISFEGLDGSGKTTQVRLLATFLENRGIPISVLREPGGTPLGEAIRSVLLSSRTVGLLPLSELLLYYAARNQNVRQNILPAQGQGKWILCDRFADASAAYQGYGRGIDLSLVKFLNSMVVQDNNPDLTLLIDINPAVALSRARKRNRQTTVDEGRFEQESLEFYQRVRQGYLQIARREPHRVHVLDGNQPIENIQEEIVRLISPLLP